MRQRQLSCFLIFLLYLCFVNWQEPDNSAKDTCRQMLRIMYNCSGITIETPLCAFLVTCCLRFSIRNVDLGLVASMTLAMHFYTNFKWIEHLIKCHSVNKCHTGKKKVDKKDTFDIIVVIYRCCIILVFEVVSGYTF